MNRCPTHPGALLREDILPEIKISVAVFAKYLHVSRQTVYAILNEETSISAEMAIRLGMFFGNGSNFWISMQSHYDLWQAQKKRGLKKIPTVRLVGSTYKVAF